MRVEPGGASPTPDAVRAELEKILASRAFAQTERLSRFLRLIVDSALARKPLNEYSIGVDVFDKPASFDPRIDPIVRVHARRLRERIRQYYDTDGTNDPIEIDLPIRSYVPSIRARKIAGPVEAAQWALNTDAANSVAVQRLTSLSSDKDDEYFAEGLTQELIHTLAGVKGLRVVSLAGLAPPGVRSPDLRQLAAQTRVHAVLDGTVRKSGRQVRVSVQLISAADGSVLWSNKYKTDVDDIGVTQEQLAHAICLALRVRMQDQQTTARGTKITRAHELFLKAKYHGSKRTREDLEKAQAYLVDALSADPDYAAAHSALAEVILLKVIHGESRPMELMPNAKAAAVRALELNPDLGDAHVSLGLVSALFEWDRATAETEFLRATDMAPSSAQALSSYAMSCLVPDGRFEEALVHLRHAQDLDPLSLSISTSLGYTLYAAGDTVKALEYLQQAIELEPMFGHSHWAAGLVYQELGKLPEAIAELEKACDLSGRLAFALGALAHAYASSGQREPAAEILDELKTRQQRRYVPAVDIGLVHLALDQRDQALACFDQAHEERCVLLPRLKIDPRLRKLRTDARFGALFQKPAA